MHHLESLMIHCLTFGLWYAVVNSWFSAFKILGWVRPSARLCEILKKPMYHISRALYACRAANISSITSFSLVRLPFDIMSSMLLESPVCVLILSASERIPIAYGLQVHHWIDLQGRSLRRTARNVQRLVTCMICMRMVYVMVIVCEEHYASKLRWQVSVIGKRSVTICSNP